MPPVKLVAFDMDGTLTTVRSSWEYVHRRLGLWDDRAILYQAEFWAGKINYAEFCRRDAALWRGIPRERLERVIAEIPLRPLARELIKALKKQQVKVALISSGLDLLAARLAEELGFDYYAANGLAARDGVLTGEPIVRVSADEPGKLKRDHLRQLLENYGLQQANVAAVGDSPGDIDMFQEASLAVLLTGDQQEAALIKAKVPHLCVVRDLGELFNLLPGVI